MKTNNQLEELINAINNKKNNQNIILQGCTGSGKSSILLDLYKYMINNMQISSNSILIMLLNRTQSLMWRQNTILRHSSNIFRTSYYGFVQSEIRKYYPLILRACPTIKQKRIQPVFLTFEAAQFLLSRAIRHRREHCGMLANLTSCTDRMAVDLAYNIVKAATSDIPLENIYNRLYMSLGVDDSSKKQIFYDFKCILSDYRDRCMQLGVFDFGISIALYNKYLFGLPEYQKGLLQRFEYIIVDNIEESVPTHVDLIHMFLNNAKTVICAHNLEGGYGRSFGADYVYVKQQLFKNAIVIKTRTYPYTCKKDLCKFADTLFDNINNSTCNIYHGTAKIERHADIQLRSTMLEKIGHRICELIDTDGYSPSDIAIICTYAEPVAEFVIGRIIEKIGHRLHNLTRNNRIIDNPFAQALVTFGQLCHPEYNIAPNKDDIKCLICMLLKIDPVRASIIADEICSQQPFAKFPEIEFPTLVEKIGYYNVEKYQYISRWIEDYKNSKDKLAINSFFERIFLEILVSYEISVNDVLEAKNLIDSAKNFVESVSHFALNANKDFLRMVASGIKSSESIFELEEKLTSNCVIMSTPINYLASALNHRVIILTGVSSKNWAPRSMKELTNIHVVTKTWDIKNIYTEELERQNQKEYLATVIRLIIKKCGEKLITYESELSGDGYENDGMLSKYFDDVLGQ